MNEHAPIERVARELCALERGDPANPSTAWLAASTVERDRWLYWALRVLRVLGRGQAVPPPGPERWVRRG